MARYFELSANTATVKLDSQYRGTVQYKVKNVSAAAIDGRAVLISLPITNPPAGAVQNGWVKIEPPTDRAFDKDKQETFIVKIEIPLKDRSKVGTYTFRLDAVTVAIPDRGDEGPAVAFTVDKAPEKKPTPMLAWLIPLIIVLLIGVGVGGWLLLRGGGSKKVPDVTKKNMTDAAAAIAAAKLTVDPKVDTISADPSLVGKVITQNPLPGTPAVANGSVHLTMGAGKTLVPLLKDQTVQQARDLLDAHQLAMGTVTNAPNPTGTAGLIYDQSQQPGVEVATNTSVDVTVAPQQVKVPDVKGQGKDAAIKAIGAAQLQIGNMACDLINSPIVDQSPVKDTLVNVGSPVNITFPCSPSTNANSFVYFRGSLAQRSMVAGPANNKLLVQPGVKVKQE
jgi:beta-lactam-binding protein with PASTA domain